MAELPPSRIVYHRVYADPPTRSELAPSQLTDDGLPQLPPPPPSKKQKETAKRKPLPKLTTQRLAPVSVSAGGSFDGPSSPLLAAALPPPKKKRLRITCISDTHNHTPYLPPGDVLIHAGDLTSQGTYSELSNALSWLQRQPHEVKLLVAGNHDGVSLDPEYTHTSTLTPAQSHAANLALFSTPAAARAGIIYLRHEARTITLRDGRRFRVFASPLSPSPPPPPGSKAWGFTYPPSTNPWLSIPADTDVLITHTPPKYHLDRSPSSLPPQPHAGCPHLRERLSQVRPVLHVFGHVHVGRGVEKVLWDDAAAPRVRHKEARVVEIQDPHPLRIKRQFLVDTIRVRDHVVVRGRETLLVNAAIATGPWSRDTGHPGWGKAVVVDVEVECGDAATAAAAGAQDGFGQEGRVRLRGVGEGWSAVDVVQ
ncbi:Metallo-dependent phosphatase-like protein [Tricharina praecox]|uniref:Metallo-dependent phosphatase-like protein n=1 Tax=Tricharina praecox TaxID=43433 RepID=UPI002220752E|nr:Metallo-dependent phosphatase-like protein [Tricharina praecox]KAI5853496.1 Metallo-dependent phosphatase-like protein [Tricharina praecox]